MSELADFFAAHGWAVVRGAVAPERVRALEAAVDELVAATSPVAGGQVWELAGASRFSSAIAAHARDAAVARRAAEALGCARLQLLQDTALVKAARVGGAVAWHQDHTYTGYLAPARAVSVRLALTDDTVGSGCLEVIDGSHALGLVGEVAALAADHVADALGPRAAEFRDRVTAIELAPGDLSIHHCLTLHRSAPNASARPRKTLVTRAFDGDCRLVPSLLPPGAAAWFPTDGDGRLAESAFPSLYDASR